MMKDVLERRNRELGHVFKRESPSEYFWVVEFRNSPVLRLFDSSLSNRLGKINYNKAGTI